MVKPVDALITAFAEAGATTITIHPEATEHLDRSLQLIESKGCRVGLAINPATPLCHLQHELHRLDNILMMSVNPGFGGQSFIPDVIDKIKEARKMINDSKRNIQLSVDGGVKIDNIRQIAAAGADTFVIGSALFGTPDYAATLQQFRQQLS
jgi:ribulose-phosphate 3-epimerase